jgi:plastocyanin
MTDWDLLTPGIGLTSIGIAGVGMSLSGIAKTFIDGMHAVSLLTMFIGMIFLASGLFKDGFPTSGRAKSATFLTLGFLVTFGVAAAVTVSTQVPSIFAYIGLMAIIGIPAAVLAVTSYRKPQYVKPIGVIFLGAAIVAGITFYAFGLVAPKPPAEEENQGAGAGSAPAAGGQGGAAPKPPERIIPAHILAGASSASNPDYDPDPIVAAKGDGVEWTNQDNVPHTVTHKVSEKPLFDSKIISPGKSWMLNTSTLPEGDYQYYCTLHPFMGAVLSVKPAATQGQGTTQPAVPQGNEGKAASAPPASGTAGQGANTTTTTTAPAAGAGGNTPADLVTSVKIAVGASTPTNGEFFVPKEVKTVVGGMVTWTNEDSAIHTVTSGDAKTGKPDGVFDSKFMKNGQKFSYVFEKAGEFDYYCQLHPFMTGKVAVS